MLRLDRVSRVFRSHAVETTALREVSLDIPAGEYVSVMGASGSGKSTLLNIAGLLDRPTTGRVLFAGEDVSRASFDRLAALRRRHVGFVFQAFHLVNDLTVLDNVAVGLAGLVEGSAERRARAHSVLEHLGLAHRAAHFPPQLSGGQQQRVAIARAMVKEPDLLICDEPTGNLDAESGERVCALIEALNENGSTVLVVTHDMSIANRARLRIGLEAGELV